jgi:Immunity protein 50
MFDAPDIPGAVEVIAWFNRWPTFHDAEVLSISLNRLEGCRVAIHAFEMTSDIDSDGHYIFTRHAIVTFSLEGFLHTRIEFFNDQNVLSSASVDKTPDGYELLLERCHGVDASIACQRMSVTLEPGIPPGSIYQPSEPGATELEAS